jgi:sigma-B regulation protein RsbU (phosphoserine phosphatase)
VDAASGRALRHRAAVALVAAALLALHVSLFRLHGLPSTGADDVLRALAVRVWLPLLGLVAGVFIGLVRPLDPHARLASWLFLSFTFVIGDIPPSLSGPWLTLYAAGANAAGLLLPCLTLAFFLSFPERAPLAHRFPWLLRAAASVSAVLWALLLAVSLGLVGRPPGLQWIAFAWIATLYSVAITVLRRASLRAEGEDRRRLRIVALSSLLGLGSLGILAVLLRLGVREQWLTALLAALVGIFPLGFVYAVVRHRVFGVSFIVRRGLQYLLLSRGVSGLQGLIMIVLGLQAARALLRRDPWALLFVVMVASIVEATLKGIVKELMPAIDRHFFREAYDARRILLDVGEDARRLTSRPQELVETFCTRIRQALHPSSVDVLRPGEDPGPRLAVPLSTDGHTHAVIALGDKLSDEPWTKEDRELLAGAAQQVAIALENARLFGQLADQQRLRREIEIARDVQQQLFPRDLPRLAGLACAGACRPALGVGGDYYDVLPLGPSRVALALGDVSGKGISAALLMARLQALLRSHAPLHPESPARVIAAVNALMCESSDGARYATLFYGVYDGAEQSLLYVNAGHNPPYLLRAGGGLQTLGEGGLVVGLVPETRYEQAAVSLQAGDSLVMFSDGITDADSPSGEMFGEDRLQAVLERLRGARPEEVRDGILGEVDHFTAGTPVSDDRTVLVARAEGGPNG